MSQTPENHCVVDFLRHGETSAGKCFLGSTDAALSERGWQQMEAAQVEEEYDLIISSPLLRCSEFARQYANKTAVPLKLESEFREINFGLWESRTSLELWQCDEEKLSAFWRDPVKHTPPEGEPLMDFKKRVLERYYSMLEENKGQKILLICHAGVIKVILCELLVWI